MSGNILTRMYRRIANGSPLWFIPGGVLLQTGILLSHFAGAWFLLEAAIGAFILFAIVAGAISNARPSSLWERLAAAGRTLGNMRCQSNLVSMTGGKNSRIREYTSRLFVYGEHVTWWTVLRWCSKSSLPHA